MAKMSLPTLPPMKHVKNGKHCYLVTFKNKWQEGKCVAVKGMTKTVAKIEGGETTGKVVWTEEFLQEHPELGKLDTYRKAKAPAKPGGRRSYFLVFEPHDEQVSLRQSFKAKTLTAGPTWVLDHIIKDSPLATALKDVFSPYNRHRKIVSLAYYMYLNSTTSMECYAAFAKNNRLPWQEPLRPSQCSQLFKSISKEDIDKFLKKLNQEVCKIEQVNVGSVNTYYALDATSFSTYAKNLTQEAGGHNKDEDHLRQINLLMLVNQKTGVPVYYRCVDGDVPDIASVLYTLRDIVRSGVNRRAIAVGDRGYFSIANIHRFYQGKASFVMNFKTSGSLARNFISKHKAELEGMDSYDPVLRQHVYSITTSWSYPINFKTNCKQRRPHERADIQVHIFFDANIKHIKTENLTIALSDLRLRLKGGSKLSYEEQKLAERLLIIERDAEGNCVSIKANKAKIAEYLFTAGYQILLSDCIADPREAYRAYQMHNSMAEAFAVWKQDLRGCFHTSTCSTTAGKIFTLFIATSIALLFKTHASYCKAMALPFDGDKAIMEELKGIKAKEWQDRLYYTEITGIKRLLLEALDIPIPDVAVFTKAEQQDLQSDQELADDEGFIASTVDEMVAKFNNN